MIGDENTQDPERSTAEEAFAPAQPAAETPGPEEVITAIATDVEPEAPAEEIKEGVVRTGPALLRVSTKNDGEQLVRKGYQFRDQSRSVTVNGRTITGATATHKDMGIILKLKPNWFRENVILGYYPEKDPYWGEPA